MSSWALPKTPPQMILFFKNKTADYQEVSSFCFFRYMLYFVKNCDKIVTNYFLNCDKFVTKTFNLTIFKSIS